MVRPRKSSAASDDSGATVQDQVRTCPHKKLGIALTSNEGAGKHVRLPCEDHITRSEW